MNFTYILCVLDSIQLTTFQFGDLVFHEFNSNNTSVRPRAQIIAKLGCYVHNFSLICTSARTIKGKILIDYLTRILFLVDLNQAIFKFHLWIGWIGYLASYLSINDRVKK